MNEQEKDKDKKAVTHIQIDDSALLETGKKLGELEERLDQIEGEKTEAFDLDAKRKELAHDFNDNRFLEAEDKKELAQMVAEVVRETQELRANTPAPSGSAPLNDAQYGRNQNSDLKSMKFESHEALVSHLRELEQNGTQEEKAEAKQVLDILWRKTVEAMKNGQNISYGSDTDNLKSEEGKSPVQVELTGSERNSPDSELQKYLARANEREREKARQKSQNYYLETEAEAQKQKERNKKVS
ncbi:MAG: hypothetical protein ABSB89_08560 [Candidatus Bathyarchaeia archaeon]|jgi:hypothetical protein